MRYHVKLQSLAYKVLEFIFLDDDNDYKSDANKTLTTGDSSLPGQCSLMTGLEMATHVQIAPATLLQLHTIATLLQVALTTLLQLVDNYCTSFTVLSLVSFYTIAPTPKHTHTHMLLHSLALHFAIALYCTCTVLHLHSLPLQYTPITQSALNARGKETCG